jgi:hypothetical protein
MQKKTPDEHLGARPANPGSSPRFRRSRLAVVFAAAGYVLLGILLWRLHHLSADDSLDLAMVRLDEQNPACQA